MLTCLCYAGCCALHSSAATHCLQPRDSVGEAGLSVEEQARQALDALTERIPETFDLEDIRGRVDEYTPYVM